MLLSPDWSIEKNLVILVFNIGGVPLRRSNSGVLKVDLQDLSFEVDVALNVAEVCVVKERHLYVTQAEATGRTPPSPIAKTSSTSESFAYKGSFGHWRGTSTKLVNRASHIVGSSVSAAAIAIAPSYDAGMIGVIVCVIRCAVGAAKGKFEWYR